MIFTQEPLPIQFCTRIVNKDSSDHLFSLVYSFKSTETRLRYIVHADYHTCGVFALKFYPKHFELSRKKYNLVTNKGHSIRIYLTIASLIPSLLEKYPESHFGIIGSRTINAKNGLIEPIEANRRFTIYSELIKELIGEQLFRHIQYPDISAYLLMNKQSETKDTLSLIEAMFQRTYEDIHDVY